MLHHVKKQKKRSKLRNESLVQLRNIIGLNQTEFARLIGVSLDLIKGVESGRNKLSSSLSHRIFLATGVDVASLHEGRGRPMYLGKITEYTKELFDDWNTRLFPNSEESAWTQFENIIAPKMLLLLLAATRPAKMSKVKNRMAGLIQSWATWADDAVANFDLKPQIEDILKQFPVKDVKTMTWGEWRRKIQWEANNLKEWREKNPGKPDPFHGDFTKKWYGFKDNHIKKDSETLTLKATSYYAWFAMSGMDGMFERLKSARGKISN